MKRIKIILGVITAFIVAFLLVGIIINDIKYTAQVAVNKPLKEVFELFNNPNETKKWIPEIKKIQAVSKKQEVKGSIYTIVLGTNDKEITMTQKIVDYVPNQRVTLFYDAENMLKNNKYVFTEEKGMTTITLHATCQSESYIMGCMFPFFKSTFKEQDQQYLTNFKEFVEQNK